MAQTEKTPITEMPDMATLMDWEMEGPLWIGKWKAAAKLPTAAG